MKVLLTPFAWLYAAITAFRNGLFDRGYLRSFRFDCVVVSVGNLKVGGTGKTPMVEYMINFFLTQGIHAGIISRGYKRKTRGFLLADEHATPSSIGDEPFQYHAKWREKVPVAVDADRAVAIPNLLLYRPDLQTIILDDAFQHRRVKRDFDIMLSEYHHPFYSDSVLPAGWLRESRQGARRADVLVVTKCPEELSKAEMAKFSKASKLYLKAETPVFYTKVSYASFKPIFNNTHALCSDFLLITGIANATPIEEYLNQQGKVVKHIEFKDHHDYTTSDVKKIKGFLSKSKSVSLVTTEKDKVKLQAYNRELDQLSCWYLPIEVQFLSGESEFQQLLLEKVRQ